LVIRHVIAEVFHRRFEEGRNPDGVHSQRADRGQSGGDARKIADAVIITIGEAARIYLVDGSPAPPFMGGRGGGIILFQHSGGHNHPPFPAPAVRPDPVRFRTISTSTMSATVTMTDAAMRLPHGTSC